MTSFALLKKEIIDPGLCIGCGMCAKTCKHITLVEKIPVMKGCIMEKNGLACGKCYSVCPIAKKIEKELAKEDKPSKVLRNAILFTVQKENTILITDLSEKLGAPISDVKYHGFRLVQDGKMGMFIKEGADYPTFTAEIE